MSRPNRGPRLILVRKTGWTRALYVIRWTEGGRTREIATGESDFGRADETFDAWKARRRKAQRSGPGDPDQVMIRDVLEDYAAEHGKEVASPETLRDCTWPLIAFFGKESMAQLTPKRVKEYWTWRRGHSLQRQADGSRVAIERRTSDGTVIRDLAGTLRPAIKHAINHKRLIPGAYHVPVPQAPRGRDYWITRKEAAALLRETRRDKRSRLHLPLYTLIALYTGQRRGAILDLTWKQIDLIAGRINFNPPGRRQTKKRRPIIPIPRSLLAALRRAQTIASSEFVIAYHGAKVGDIKKGFNSAARRAGIPDCTSHTLRHTAGTMMAQRGVPLREIAGYLGHSEARTTELYCHHHADFMQNARKAWE